MILIPRMENAENSAAPLNLFSTFWGSSGAGAELQQHIYDNVPSLIYVYDATTKKLGYINKKVTELLGFDLDEIHGWENQLDSLTYKDDLEAAREAINKLTALQSNETHTYQSRLNHKQGNWKYFRTTGSVLKRNDKGDATSFLFIAEDITSAHASEQEIEAKNKLITETEEILQFGTWSWDAETNKLTLSDGLFALIGSKRQDAEMGLDYYLQFVSQEDITVLTEKIKASVISKQDFSYTYNLTTAAGEHKIVCSTGKVVLSSTGQLAKIIGVTRNVTQQENAYRELLYYKQMTLEKERFLESGSWELDMNTGKLMWSDGMYRLFEYEPDADGNYPSSSVDFYYSHLSVSQAEKNRKAWDNFIKNKNENYYVVESTITANNGEVKRLETFAKIIRDENGAPVTVMGASKNITRLREYERQLEKRLSDLERSNKELEEFAYVASHDLQEPLRKVSTFSERLQIKYEGLLGDEGKAYISRMQNATANMRMLIDNLLNFSRLTSKKVEYEKVNLDKLLDETLSEIELQVDESGTKIVRAPLPVLEVIPSQIKQLFSNIILNSIKFAREGVSPVIAIACSKLTQQENEAYKLQKDLQYYAISIQDNGIGFEQEYAEKIFQIFQRLHGKAEYPGAGIGLAICKKIAENHHGKLLAVGKPGEGATFTVLLPEVNN